MLLIIISPIRYIQFLPTIPIYPNSEKEVLLVEKQVNLRNKHDLDFFKLTDKSVSPAFSSIVPISIKELDNMIKQFDVAFIILFFKYLINRPRPKQIKPSLNVLTSISANTPAYPAGHAFQAYYLAKKLGKSYPELQPQLDSIAERCNSVRIKAGLHYPSDGEFSKQLVKFFY
ncbi:MAG: hypothetical protein ACXAES_16725 [Promethearchaeota archaeon]